MPKFVTRLAVAAIVASSLIVPVVASASESPPGYRPFAPDSIWNLPLRTNAPIAADSQAGVDWLRMQVGVNGSYINATSCGMPITWAASDTPRVPVKLAASSHQEKALIYAWKSVPIPPNVQPANCQDKNFAVLQQQPDGSVTQWEFWSAHRREDGSWEARWGGVTQDVAIDRGVASTWAWRDWSAPTYAERTSGTSWNVTATSISMTAGVITEDDMRSGVIDHAVAMATTDAAAGFWHWPAQRTDGGSIDPAALPEGARLRVDPSVDLDALTMTPLVRMIAKAAQKYGIVIRDRTYSANVFYVESPEPGQISPVRSLLNGAWPDKALLAFPWTKLQVLEGKTCRTTGSCLATPKVVIDVDTPEPRVGEPVELDTSNSVLEHTRTAVEWDFDGDGSYESARGRAVKASFTPGAAGRRQVGVKITIRDGSVVAGTQTIDVQPAFRPVLLRPTAVKTQYFYGYSTHGALQSIDAPTMPPDRPDRYRKLYSNLTSGSFEVTFGGEESVDSIRSGATLRAWVDCSATRCLRLRVQDASGMIRGSAEAAFGESGWVDFRVAGPLTPAGVQGLRLRGSTSNGPSPSGSTSVSAVSLEIDG